jgi:hypothetical protein
MGIVVLYCSTNVSIVVVIVLLTSSTTNSDGFRRYNGGS